MKLKPLVWQGNLAETPIGSIRVMRMDNEPGPENAVWDIVLGTNWQDIESSSTIEEAKKKAEEWLLTSIKAMIDED